MIERYKARELIFDTVPDFKNYWHEKINIIRQGREPINECGDLDIFFDYVDRHIRNEQPLELNTIFKLIEQLMTDGDEKVRTGVATCFLENLQNAKTPPEKWVHLLGEKSRNYCKAWDGFTGVETPGLWSDESFRRG